MVKVLYYGPITPKGQANTGGYAAANRKNCDELRRQGVEVIEVPKKSNIGLLFQPFQLLFSKHAPNTIIHIATPLAGVFMIPVWLIETFARLKNIPVVLDVRAGVFISRFKKYNALFRWLTETILNKASLVAVEGFEYIAQLKEVVEYKKDAYYFPNIVDCTNLQVLHKNTNTINLFYFGRITECKGVSIMLQIIQALGKGYHLYLAGPIASDIEKSSLEIEGVTYLGLLTSDQLKEQMEKMHIFIFPTHHEGEGQSNSLIEAMSHGLIPVVTNNGFCQEVVGDCGIVLSMSAGYKEYVQAIKRLSSQNINTLARRCAEHINTNHNLSVEIKGIIAQYKRLVRMYDE